MSSVAPTHSLNSLADNTVSARLAKKTTRHVRERLIEGLLFLAASVSVVVTVGIVLILLTESYQFFKQVSLVDFLTDNQWTPLFDDAHYGIMVLLSGTLVSSFVALAVAIPLGTIIAIYLSEFAPFTVREVAKPFLELLGGVPTIVYGYFALLYVLFTKLFPIISMWELKEGYQLQQHTAAETLPVAQLPASGRVET